MHENLKSESVDLGKDIFFKTVFSYLKRGHRLTKRKNFAN